MTRACAASTVTVHRHDWMLRLTSTANGKIRWYECLCGGKGAPTYHVDTRPERGMRYQVRCTHCPQRVDLDRIHEVDSLLALRGWVVAANAATCHVCVRRHGCTK